MYEDYSDVEVNFTDEFEDWLSDIEADADTLASAGHGTDEDYGWYGYEDAAMEMGLFGSEC